MRKFIAILAAATLLAPAVGFAAEADLQQKIDELNRQLNELSTRVDKTEKKATLDHLNWYGDLRVKADTLHWQDSVWSPGVSVDTSQFMAAVMSNPTGWGYDFGADATPMTADDAITPGSPLANFMTAYGFPLSPAALGGMGGVQAFTMQPGSVVKPKNLDNNIAYTTRLRLNTKATVASNVDFAGRLAMYKNWGDSTGVKVFDSWNSFTMDGTDGGNTTGDMLRVERAYFDWKDIAGSNFYLSIGRRPSTYGPPSQYRENELRGGTPSGHLVHFNFDGITAGYKLSEITGVEGQTVRFCYGQGFESKVGNGELFGDTATKDTHLGGFNVDLLNDGSNFVQLTAFAAQDVVDGFKGTFAFPTQMAPLFAPVMYQDMQNFPTFNFVTRYQPSTVIGDMKLAGLGMAREEDDGLKYFGSLGWTRLEPNGKAGMFGGMGSDMVYNAALSSDGSRIIMVPTGKVANDDNHDGYGLYAGVQIPAGDGKLGFEYNYGSKYWTPFTQAQDDLLGSKLSTRGQVGELYYIFDINPNMFIKVGGLYYDYQYTNSGSPVGAPQKVDDVLKGKAYSMLPVADTAWNGYTSLTVKF